MVIIIKKTFKVLIYLLLVITVMGFFQSCVLNILSILGLNYDIRVWKIMFLVPFLFIINLIMTLYCNAKDDGKYKYGSSRWIAAKYAPKWMLHLYPIVNAYAFIVIIIYSQIQNDGRVWMSCILIIAFSLPIPVFTSYILKDKRNRYIKSQYKRI